MKHKSSRDFVRCFCWIPFMAKIAVLGSGTGSNFQALVEEFGDEIVLVISDQPGAGILEKAKAFGIPTAVEVGGADLSARILKRLGGVDLICLAGYMRLVKEPLLSAFPNRILNIHPSLLPKYPGKAAWEQALADQAEVTGCTVHYVDAGIDTGEVILQEKVEVLIDDTATTLHARIQIAEHRVYPQAVKRVLKKMSGRV
ncbi:phosphoribosylglycinamide formyltransferase [Akkermansiaceae bacterium]|nr:phosphoribosylglycinamide formyltransferase [Akkermansiaceae bacterium]MDB4450092.1 phosphoribosylglycinamide formyltransferase [Akkermansiaceae bacterium]MDB4483045.1 phosphoribosylglycinamide formyltransferase [Akkermansiaceae bacterium]